MEEAMFSSCHLDLHTDKKTREDPGLGEECILAVSCCQSVKNHGK